MRLQESEYREQDEFRAKIADANQWMDFETKMRSLVQDLIAPVVQASILNRENALLLQESNKDLNKRTVLLEKATFQTGKYKKPTLIETMLMRIESMEK